MPAKPKGSVKASTPEAQAAPTPASSTPTTVAVRTEQRFLASNVLQNKVNEQGYNNLAPAEKKTYAHAKLLLPVCQERVPLNAKTERDFWKLVNKESLPIRQLRDDYNWGKDKSGRDISTYTIEDLDKRTAKQAQLAALKLLHQHFLSKRRLAQQKGTDLPKEVVEEEKERRLKMSGLRKDLYGQIEGTLANDPEWDDIVPIANTEPEDALAKIAYPDDYAEAVSYLRAVMAAEEYSPRCLRLTDLVIEMNPAHYTVWLYRFKIVRELNLSVPDEIKWLNEVSLENLKNYQIWHHRQLLLNYYYPILTSESADSAQAINDLAKSERDFISVMLKEDTKNYHVWSYRQALVKKLGQFNVAELASTQNLIEDDVRNNSAWSHRFFLTFADPAHSTPDSGPTEHDAKVPDTIIDKEVKYAQEKIALAPQNQSPWNYMRGVLAKGGRKLSSVAEFAEQYVDKLGQDDEVVRSSHALDLLSEVYAEQSDKAKAKLCLERLATKWDPVREGYWKYRESQLA